MHAAKDLNGVTYALMSLQGSERTVLNYEISFIYKNKIITLAELYDINNVLTSDETVVDYCRILQIFCNSCK